MTAIGLLSILFSPVAGAFQKSDGTNVTCQVSTPSGPQDAVEQYVNPGSLGGLGGFTHLTAPGGPWVIQFDPARLQQIALQLPIAMDFLFYHECAHAQLATSNEVQANCGALIRMRQEGLLGAGQEQALGQFHQNLGAQPPQYLGSGAAFWQATLSCANAASVNSSPPPPPPPIVPHYCCTAFGRFGPYPNATAGVGQQCYVPTPKGPLYGSTCN